MAKPKLSSNLDFSGPFFERDPLLTIADNIRLLLQEVGDDMADDIRQQLAVGESGRKPIRAIGPAARVSQFVRARVEALSGKKWHYHAVVSVDRTGLSAPQAIALLAAGAKLEAMTGAFRRTTRVTKRQKTDLTKGLE